MVQNPATDLILTLQAKVLSSLLAHPKITSYSNYELLMIYTANALKLLLLLLLLFVFMSARTLINTYLNEKS